MMARAFQWLAMAIVGWIPALCMAQDTQTWYTVAGGKWNTGPVLLLQSSSVVAELKLIPEQKEWLEKWTVRFHLELLRDADRLLNETVQLGQVQQMHKVLNELRIERIESAYAELQPVLTSMQWNRLKQIDIQVAGLDAFERLDIGKNFVFRQDQKQLLESLTRDLQFDVAALRHEFLQKASPNNEDRADYEQERREMHDRALLRFFRTFTKEQRRAYSALCGDVFPVQQVHVELLKEIRKV